MCKFCDNTIHHDVLYYDLCYEITYNSPGYLTIDKEGVFSIETVPRAGESYSVVYDIKYCPICGKKLVKEGD